MVHTITSLYQVCNTPCCIIVLLHVTIETDKKCISIDKNPWFLLSFFSEWWPPNDMMQKHLEIILPYFKQKYWFLHNLKKACGSQNLKNNPKIRDAPDAI